MVNRVVLIGRLTRDPNELRVSPSGISVTNFTVAVDNRFSKQEASKADFIPVVVFNKLAEFITNYARKGALVAVEGRIQTGSYEKDGQRIYTTDVVADSVQFLESKAQSQNRGSDMDVTPADFVSQDNSMNEESDMSDEVFANFGDSIEISDDDIAF